MSHKKGNNSHSCRSSIVLLNVTSSTELEPTVVPVPVDWIPPEVLRKIDQHLGWRWSCRNNGRTYLPFFLLSLWSSLTHHPKIMITRTIATLNHQVTLKITQNQKFTFTFFTSFTSSLPLYHLYSVLPSSEPYANPHLYNNNNNNNLFA